MESILYGALLIILGIWIVKEHKNAKKHREGKKVLDLSGSEWIKVLERSIEESWMIGLFYGAILGVLFMLFLESIKKFFV